MRRSREDRRRLLLEYADSPPWTPAALGPVLWLDAGYGVTLAGTKAATWASRVSTPVAAQAVDAQRPTYGAASFAGKPGLSFERGANQYLDGALAAQLTAAATIVAAVSLDNSNNGVIDIVPVASTNAGIFLASNSGSVAIARRLVGDDATHATPVSTPCIMSATYTDALRRIFINGVAGVDAVTNKAVAPHGNFRIGSLWGAWPSRGVIAEILVYQTALSDTDRRLGEKWLGAKYGIAVV